MPKISLYSWNVNGIRAAIRKDFVGWFTKTKPDVLCLQETKAQDDQIAAEIMEAEGYHVTHHAADKKGYSGVLTMSKEKPSKVMDLGVDEFDCEGRTIVSKFKNYTLLNVYFPNGKKNKERLDYKMRFYEHFLEYILKLRENGENVIFCGDVNTAHKEIDLTHPKPNSKYSGFLPIERQWMDKVAQNDFFDTFREFHKEPERYTWWSLRSGARARNVGWRIDYFFADENLKSNVVDADVLSGVLGSDHCPISLELNF